MFPEPGDLFTQMSFAKILYGRITAFMIITSSASEFVSGDLIHARSHGLGSRDVLCQVGALRKDFAMDFSAPSTLSRMEQVHTKVV